LDEIGLSTIPKGDWYCTKCTEEVPQKRSRGGKAATAKVTKEPVTAPAPEPVRTRSRK
jgi:hypothetical protein